MQFITHCWGQYGILTMLLALINPTLQQGLCDPFTLQQLVYFADQTKTDRPPAKLSSSQTAGIASPSSSLLPPSPEWQLPQLLLLTICHIRKASHIL